MNAACCVLPNVMNTCTREDKQFVKILSRNFEMELCYLYSISEYTVIVNVGTRMLFTPSPVCMCIHMCLRVCIAYVCLWTYTCLCEYIWVCVWVYLLVCLYMLEYVYTLLCVHAWMYTCVHVRVNRYTCMRSRMRRCKYPHACLCVG